MHLEGLRLGNYKLIRLIGRGGMGEVFLAQDTRIGRQVAIKIMRNEMIESPNTDEKKTAERLFQREMRIITQLDHSNILPLYDFGEEKINNETFIYMVMPYRADGSFASWLSKRGSYNPLTQQDVAYFMHQAADALMHAHEAGIIHQDVKPPNFLIRQRSDQPGRPDLLLTDFGIARAMNTSATALSQQVRGTPGYMAPEQWSGEPGPATDQYALAIMAYELLVGRPPFQGSSMQVMYKHLNEQPTAPSRLNPQLATRIDNVLLKALAKQPQDRFSSVKAFALALEEAIGAGKASAPTVANAQAQPSPFVLPPTVTPYNNASPQYDPTVAQTPGGKSHPPLTPAQKPRHRARSTTLVSLVIALIVGGIITGAIIKSLPDQQGNNNPTVISNPTVDVQATQTYSANSTTTVVLPTGNGSGSFSTSFENGNTQPTWTNTGEDAGFPAGGSSNIGGICCGLTGPELISRNEIAHHGSTSLLYSGNATNASSADYAYLKAFDLRGQNIMVDANTTLSYWIFPQSSHGSSNAGLASGNNSTCVAVDLIFQDSSGNPSSLRESGALDENGNRAHPAYQCNKLTLDSWNHVTVNLGAYNNGLKVTRLDVGYDQPRSSGGYRGYIDDISISN